MENLPVEKKSKWTPSLAEQRERDDHRVWIAGRALTLLRHYYRPDDPIELTAALGADWARVLEPLTQDAIDRACILYQQGDRGKTKPAPAHIYHIAKGLMPAPRVVRRAPLEPVDIEPPCSPDVADAICAAAGYKPKRMEG